MKSVILSLMILAIVIVGSLAFRNKDGGSVVGTVAPVNSGSNAWMVSGTDTFKTQVKTNAFEFANVKRGSYTLIIEAVPPFKNGIKNNISITEGTITNVGEIVLTQ